MKLSKFANLVKNGGRCAVLHVAGSGIWLSTGTAIYRATELPDMEYGAPASVLDQVCKFR